MITPHRTLQQALDALETDPPLTEIAKYALREALAAPPAAPADMVMVPKEPTEEMIQAAAGAWGESESGLHNAFAAALRGGIAAAPAAPVAPNGCERIFTHKWLDPDCIEQGCKSLAAPVVPLTEGRITAIANELAFGGGHCNVYELARAIEKAHGIGGGNG